MNPTGLTTTAFTDWDITVTNAIIAAIIAAKKILIDYWQLDRGSSLTNYS